MVVQTGQVFDSIKECAIQMGLIRQSIYDVLSGKQKTHRGYTFKLVKTTPDIVKEDNALAEREAISASKRRRIAALQRMRTPGRGW